MSDKFRILLLASGAGSLAQSIIDAHLEQILQIEIVGLISDRQCAALERAHSNGLLAIELPMSGDRNKWNNELIKEVSILNPELVVSVGFMRILPPEFVQRFSVINCHPSLLPNFPGAHAVRDALKSGASVTGCTVHWVDEGIDTGKVIAQREVPIHPDDDENSLHERIKIEERRLIIEVLQEIIDKSR